MRNRDLAHFRRAARYLDEGDNAKARAHFRRGIQLSAKSGFGGRESHEATTQVKVTLLSSDDVSFVVDVDVAHMFAVMREMQVDGSEVVPIPSVDGATLGKALEFCEAHVASGANEARDDAYAASVHRDMLFRLVRFADKWSCEPLLRVLARRCVRIIMEEYDSAEALRAAFGIRDELTEGEMQAAAGHAPLLIASLRKHAFECHRDYFHCLQEVTFVEALGGLYPLGEHRFLLNRAQHAMAGALADDLLYTAFLAQMRCVRENLHVPSGLAEDLLMLRTNVWYVMHQQLCLMGHFVLQSGIGRGARWPNREQMGLCTCGTAMDGQLLIAHGYYDSETHQSDLQRLKRGHCNRGNRGLVLRPHSGKGLLRYARQGVFTKADTCTHQGEPWTCAVSANGLCIA
jgi:hypothetical protein